MTMKDPTPKRLDSYEKKNVPNQFLKQARERRGWTREYVAEAIGLPDAPTIGRWERGVSFPSPHYRQELCRIFEMDAEDLGLIRKGQSQNENQFLEIQQIEQSSSLAGVGNSASNDSYAPLTLVSPRQFSSPRIFKRRLLIGGVVAFLVATLIFGIAFFNITSSRPSSAPPPTATSPMFGANPQHTHFYPYEHTLSASNVAGLSLNWVGATQGSIAYSSPAIVDGRAYIGSTDGRLYAFDEKTGRQLWQAATNGPIGSSPAVAHNTVYSGSEDHRLYAFDAVSGRVRWVSAPTNGPLYSSPLVVNEIVYIGSTDGHLYAFNEKTGQKLWASITGGKINSSPAFSANIIVVGSEDHYVYAFDASDGHRLWRSVRTGDIVDSSPAIANNVVYIGSWDHSLYAFDLKNGNTLWTEPTKGSINSSPALANGIIYIGSSDKNLYAFDMKTHAQLWQTATDGPLLSSPAVANGIVYVGSAGKQLYAFNAATGSILWSYAANEAFLSSPAVINGTVYIGSTHLLSFHLQPQTA